MGTSSNLGEREGLEEKMRLEERLRLVVPKLYGWKSAKWVRGLEFLPQANHIELAATAA